VREVYGQTENTALATATPEDGVRIGKVGRRSRVEVRIADDGEVLVRSPSFLGYLGDEAGTQAAYDDGWLRAATSARSTPTVSWRSRVARRTSS
jgi:long-chain acyl-CoA synthetase